MKSIRQRLTMTILPGFGLLLVLSGVAIYWLTRVALFREFDANLQAKALTIMSLTEQGKDGIQLDISDTHFQGIDDKAAPQYYELWRANKTIIARSESLKGVDLPLRFGPTIKPEFWNVTLPDGQPGRAIGLSFLAKTEEGEARHGPEPEAVIVVGAERASLDQTLATLATVLATTFLLAMVVTVPLVNFSLRRGHAPLGQLAGQAAGITADSLQTRFAADSMPEELRPVANCLNDLLQRLEQSFERERRFSADLAHELRTPLAELRSLAEVELAWPENEGAEKHRETLNIALQMEATVTRLLELARCEDGKISFQLELVRIAPLLNEIWEPLATKAKNRRLAFCFDVPVEVAWQTDRALLRSILTNLLANSVEYAPQDGHIEIVWDGARGELAVSNTVDDLNPADLPHLFERLWRKDKARTDSTHCGLGLALSRTFAGLLGFSLEARFKGEKNLAMVLNVRRG